MKSASIEALIFGSALFISAGAACADEPSTTVTLTAQQAQARQFGMLLGGTATQYDVCAGKGFLPKGAQSAEDIAEAYFEKMKTTSIGPGDAAYVREGWTLMKKEVTEHEAFFTRDKCVGVGKEWATIMATLKKK